MKRRSYLTTAAVGVVSLTGCLSQAGSSDEDPPMTDSPGDLTDQSIETVSQSCGTETHSASISRNADKGQLTVEGTTTGETTCHVATITAAEYHSGDTFRIEISSEKEDADNMCTQCITEVKYAARFSFDGKAPKAAEVFDGDELVAELD